MCETGVTKNFEEWHANKAILDKLYNNTIYSKNINSDVINSIKNYSNEINAQEANIENIINNNLKGNKADFKDIKTNYLKWLRC